MVLYDYKEFGGNNNRSIIEHFNTEPYPEKEIVLKYLKTAGEKRAFCGLIKDVIDDSIHGSSVLFRDDTYSWLSDIVYYVERYNFRPEEEFIKYVLSKQNVRFESKEKGEDKP